MRVVITEGRGGRTVEFEDPRNLRDENGFLKPTAAYHTSKQTKASRGTRSCHVKMGANVPVEYSSDEDTATNRSYHSSFNPAEVSKRNFRRSSKRHKKAMPNLEEYDDQSSSTTSNYNILQPMDMNAHHHKAAEYWKRHNRYSDENSLFQIEVFFAF